MKTINKILGTGLVLGMFGLNDCVGMSSLEKIERAKKEYEMSNPSNKSVLIVHKKTWIYYDEEEKPREMRINEQNGKFIYTDSEGKTRYVPTGTKLIMIK